MSLLHCSRFFCLTRWRCDVQEHKAGSAGVLSREVELETELREARTQLGHFKAEKLRLEQSINELQARLTDMESQNYSSGGGDGVAAMEAALKRGEREKSLEMMVSTARSALATKCCCLC